MRAIRTNARNFAALIGLIAVGLAVGGYILSNQRVRFPWEETPFTLKFELPTAQATTPGQGQTIRISGIRVGDISKVELIDGHAVVTGDIDQKYAPLLHTDATALLRPKTGLKDMFIELRPGTKAAARVTDGWSLPLSGTLPDVNPDEILAALDTDTRDYLTLLINGAGTGLAKRGSSLQDVLARFEPTHRDLARVNTQVAKRSRNLKRLVHSLNELNAELASKDDDLAELVGASSEVFRAFASEQANVTDAVDQLPDALQQTTRTLGKVESFARELRPAADALRPAARRLDSANRALLPFAEEAAPLVASPIRPFVRATRPLARELEEPSARLAKATPDLTGSFTTLNHLFNMLAYNSKGREGPGVKDRDEGYLFWVAWLQHNAAALFSSADANGSFRPVTLAGFCGTLKQAGDTIPGLGMVLAPALFDPKVCSF